MTARRLGRASALLVVAAAISVAVASPADAHTRTEETTNVHSRLTAADVPDGVEVVVHTGGLLIEVRNDSPVPLLVHGYDGEPYLRIGPDGVEHNRRSPAAHLNRERYGNVAMPPDVDPTAAPEWVTIGSRPVHVWHDHRTHWMSPQPPGFVDAGVVSRTLMGAQLVGPIGRAHDDAGSFQPWTIPLTHDGATATIEGELVWVDPPSPWPWLALAAILVAGGLAGLRRDELGATIRPAALVLGAVAAVNAIHLVDDLVAWPSDPLDELSGLLHTSIFLIGGLGGALWAWFGRSGRILALGIGSASVLYHQGIVHLPMLFASAFPTVWPDALVRLTIALGLLQAPVVAVVIARVRRRWSDASNGHLARGLDDPVGRRSDRAPSSAEVSPTEEEPWLEPRSATSDEPVSNRGPGGP
jgi:hypothetical protein